MPAKTVPKQEVTAGILAQVLFELNPARTVEEWLDHVKKHGNNPKAFFNGNGEGLEEYNAFVRTYDKDTHDRIRNTQTRRNK